MKNILKISLIVLMFGGVSSALAQDSLLEYVVESCESDLEQYCSQVTPGNGRLLYCVAAHEDKLSGQCSYALYEAASLLEDLAVAIEYVAVSCETEIETLCKDVALGEGRILECLVDNEAAVGKTASRPSLTLLASKQLQDRPAFAGRSTLRNKKMTVLDVVKKDVKSAKWTGWLLVILGILALASPLVAGLSITMLIGVLLIAGGIAQLVMVFRAGSFGSGITLAILGGLSLVAGLYTVTQPAAALGALTLFLALYFVASGILEVIGAVSARPADGWGWVLAGGIVSVLLGIMIWQQFPFSGVWAIGILVGVRLLISGITFITIGSVVGGFVKKVA